MENSAYVSDHYEKETKIENVSKSVTKSITTDTKYETNDVKYEKYRKSVTGCNDEEHKAVTETKTNKELDYSNHGYGDDNSHENVLQKEDDNLVSEEEPSKKPFAFLLNDEPIEKPNLPQEEIKLANENQSLESLANENAEEEDLTAQNQQEDSFDDQFDEPLNNSFTKKHTENISYDVPKIENDLTSTIRSEATATLFHEGVETVAPSIRDDQLETSYIDSYKEASESHIDESAADDEFEISIRDDSPKHSFGQLSFDSQDAARDDEAREMKRKHKKKSKKRNDFSNYNNNNIDEKDCKIQHGTIDNNDGEIQYDTFDGDGNRVNKDGVPPLELDKSFSEYQAKKQEKKDDEFNNISVPQSNRRSIKSCMDLLIYNDLYVRQNWDGRLKVLEFIATFLAAVILPSSYEYYDNRYIFHRLLAIVCVIGIAIDLFLHLFSLWEHIPEWLKSSSLMLCLTFVGSVAMLSSSSLIVGIADVNEDESKTLTSALAGYVAMVLFGIETVLHFFRYRASMPLRSNHVY